MCAQDSCARSEKEGWLTLQGGDLSLAEQVYQDEQHYDQGKDSYDASQSMGLCQLLHGTVKLLDGAKFATGKASGTAIGQVPFFCR